uniref:Apolipophorin-III n=1 Tax=Cuerna arida TaxID=1464854 RepID=A0A1B6G7A4_9HEMI
MSPRTVSFICLLVLALSVRGDKTAEEPLSFMNLLENLNTKFQNVTHTVEGIIGVDIPSTQEEVKATLQENVDKIKASAQSFQKKIAEYNVNGTTLTGVMSQVQTKINQTLEELGQRNPDVGKLLEQVKTGYGNLAAVSKSVQEAVEQQAGTASDDLKALVQHAGTELSKSVSQLESKVQDLLAETKKKQ